MCGALAHVCFGPKADIAGYYVAVSSRFAAVYQSTYRPKPIIVVLASTEIRVRRSIFALLVLTNTAHAQLVIFTYDQWERLSPGLQEIYLAGAIDSLSTHYCNH